MNMLPSLLYQKIQLEDLKFKKFMVSSQRLFIRRQEHTHCLSIKSHTMIKRAMKNEEEISDEELAMSYKLLCDTWMDVVKDNKSFQGLVSQFSKEKNIK